MNTPETQSGGSLEPVGSAWFAISIQGQRTSFRGRCAAQRLVQFVEFLVSSDSLDCASAPEKGPTPPLLPNDVREQRGPAATDVRTAIDLNGWSPSAPRNCWATSSSRPKTLMHTKNLIRPACNGDADIRRMPADPAARRNGNLNSVGPLLVEIILNASLVELHWLARHPLRFESPPRL